MELAARNKGNIVDYLKKGSRRIGIFCLLAMLFNLAAAVLPLIRALKSRAVIGDITIALSMGTKISLCRRCISSGILAVIMLLAALVFFRIAKDGMPFQAKNVRTVRIISILFLLNAVLPLIAVYAICGSVPDMISVFSPAPIMEGLLFLFVAHTVRYGAMLQQESDETL